jgi:CRISPR-associated protein Cas8b/Csh1 subtype I-B
VLDDDGHPDGWVVEALGQVFEKGSETLEQIGDDIESLLTGSDPTVITVAAKIDTTDLDNEDDRGVATFRPGDLDVLDAAMRRYKTKNATDRNLNTGSSEGEAAGFVTGDRGRVVGTPESPLDTFSIKHPDVQPGLRRTASWRNYPIDERTAQLIAKGEELIERCVERQGGMETYALPYFAGDLTPQKAETLYNAILSLDPDENSDRPPMARITYDIAEADDEEIRALEHELRFHYVTLPIGDDTHVIAESSAATTYWVNEIADALVTTLMGPTCAIHAGGFGLSDNWTLLDPPTDTDAARRWAFYRIVGHEFVNATFGYRDDVEDDFRRVVDQWLIEGRSIDESVLFEEYARRLGDAFDGDAVPWQIAATQFVQFEALSRAGLLSGTETPVAPNHTEMTSNSIESTDIDTIRERRLESFLDRPMFTEGSERRAAFLAGVLIGQVSWHQENERAIGQPLDTRTQADKLTPRVLEQTLQAALDNARIYAAESDYGDNVLFPEVIDRLLDSMATQPTEWAIEKRELQFMVALGQSFGRRAMPVAFDIRQENSSTETDASTTEQEA